MDDFRSTLPRFEQLTETTGLRISLEAAAMMYTRYRLAADLAVGARVLELGCGAGQGFGLIGRQVRSLIGGDLSLNMLKQACRQYHGRFPVAILSADALPFHAGAFDVVIFCEASYYVPDLHRSLQEIARVLSPGGVALLVNANPERPGFIRSPRSIHYATADEFRDDLTKLGFSVIVEAAFPINEWSRGVRTPLWGSVLGGMRTAAGRLGLVPRTLRGRSRLKALFHRNLVEVPGELDEGFSAAAPRVAVPRGPVREYKVLYVVAKKQS